MLSAAARYAHRCQVPPAVVGVYADMRLQGHIAPAIYRALLRKALAVIAAFLILQIIWAF